MDIQKPQVIKQTNMDLTFNLSQYAAHGEEEQSIPELQSCIFSPTTKWLKTLNDILFYYFVIIILYNEYEHIPQFPTYFRNEN